MRYCSRYPKETTPEISGNSVVTTAKSPRKSEGSKEVVDLRPQNGGFPIFNQGHLGSCTANALAAAYHFTLHKQLWVESVAAF